MSVWIPHWAATEKIQIVLLCFQRPVVAVKDTSDRLAQVGRDSVVAFLLLVVHILNGPPSALILLAARASRIGVCVLHTRTVQHSLSGASVRPVEVAGL